MLKPLQINKFKCVSFCKNIFNNKKNTPDEQELLINNITKCILYIDNYLITRHQALAIAEILSAETPAGLSLNTFLNRTFK